MSEFKRLSLNTMKKYDFNKTKKNVDKFMEPLYELLYQYRHISPPTVSFKNGIVGFHSSGKITNPTEDYALRKINTEEKVKEYYKLIESILETLRYDERICMKAEYLEELTREGLSEKLNCSIPTIVSIKKSAIIKFALSLGIAVKKGEK